MTVTVLSAFNPHEFSEATVRAVATGRETNLKEILAAIRSNLQSQTIQHLILSAPRGYGKSFMMRHIQIEVERIGRDEVLPLSVVLMPEELPHVKEPETLIRELTRALSGGAAEEAELSWHEDDGAVWETAAETLNATIRQKVGARGLLVALVENFDVLLRRAFPKEVQASRLRSLLTEQDGRLMLIAASASGAFDRSYDNRLFQAFKEVALEPWSLEDCLAFFDRQRTDAGKPPLDDSAKARAKSVASFIGGTPRLATLLGDALFDKDVLRAADLLQKLVDELTPYYKERIEALPGRSQKLLDALLRAGEPATQSEIARRVNAKSQAAIAGPFTDLIKERIVIGEKAPDSAEVLYRVADRVFAHYYRRRIIDHGRAGCPLEALVDLLAEYFSPEEKRNKAAEFAQRGRIEEARIMARLYESDRGSSKRNRLVILRILADYYIPKRLIPLASNATAQQLRTVADLVHAGAIDHAYSELDAAFKSANLLEDRVLLLLGRSRLDAYEGIEGGLSAVAEAVTIAEQLGGIRFELAAKLGRASSLEYLSRNSEALDLTIDLAKQAELGSLAEDQAYALRGVSRNLGRLGRYDEALAKAQQSADVAKGSGIISEEALALTEVAHNLGQLERYEDAVVVARQAAVLFHKEVDLREKAWALSIVVFSLGKLVRHEEAIATGEQAVDLAQKAGDAATEAQILNYIAGDLNRLDRSKEAIAAARRAVDLANKAGNVQLECEAGRLLAWYLSDAGDNVAAIDAIATAAKLFDAHLIKDEDELLPITAEGIASRAAGLLASDANDLDRVHKLLRSAAENLDFDGLRRTCLQSWLRALVKGMILRVQDARTLHVWVSAIEAHFPVQFDGEVSRLRDTAAYHESRRDHAALSRLEPDLARTLEMMFPPFEQSPKKNAKSSRKPPKRKR